MTKIYARWTVWLHHWLLIENSLKQKPQRAAFNFFFFLTIQWLLTRKQLCPQLHNSHSWYRELCARIWVLNLCQNMKKMPCKEEIHTLFGLGRGILFIYWTTEYLLEVWMFSFLLLCLLIFFFLYGCSGKQIRRDGLTYTKSFNISISVSSLKFQSTELMVFVTLI